MKKVLSFASKPLRTAHHLGYLRFWNAGREESTGCNTTGSLHDYEGIVVFETKVVEGMGQNLLKIVLCLLV